MSYLDIKHTLQGFMDTDYRSFVKALISIEKGIEDEKILDQLYQSYMDNDQVMLINEQIIESFF